MNGTATDERAPVGAIAAAALGNGIELYDFTIYSFFALTIGKLFFPIQSEFGPLLLALLTFGIGFVARPLGSVIIGAYADRAGRKPALNLTFALMALGTTLIGLCPTYDRIGVLAPLTIVAGRILQGFSAGGEIGASSTLLLEMGPREGSGVRVSWQMASQGGAALAGALCGFALSAKALDSGLWRLPFLAGLVIGPAGLWVRGKVRETAAPRGPGRRPLAELMRHNRRQVLCGILAIIGGTASTYVVIFYMPTYLIKVVGMPRHTAFLSGCVAGATMLAVSPLAGLLADLRRARKPLVVWSNLVMLAAAVPAFTLLAHAPGEPAVLATVAFLVACSALGSTPCLLLLMESFAPRVRATGLSLVYAVGVSIFGGFAQFAVTWLLSASGDPAAPSWYVAAGSCAALCGLALLPEKAPQG